MSDDLAALTAAAIKQFQSENISEAERLCAEILHRAPENVGALHLQARIGLRSGRLDESILLLERCVALEPHRIGVYLDYGQALNDADRMEESLGAFTVAAGLRPDHPGIYYSIGNAHVELESYDEAVASYQQALRLDPSFIAARSNLGAALRFGRQFEAAIEALSTVETPDARYLMLECLLELGRHDAFFAAVRQFSEVDDTDRRVAAISAYAAELLGCDDPYPYCQNPLDHIRVIDDCGGLATNPALLGGLISEVRGLATVFEPRKLSTRNGFQTVGTNLFELATDGLMALRRAISAEIVRYRAETAFAPSALSRKWPEQPWLYAWYVRLLRGGYQNAHIHPPGWLSGVVYLAVPDESQESQAGHLEFQLGGPSYPSGRGTMPRQVVRPIPGRLVLFPSSLHHRTIPFAQGDERTSIAFDLRPD